ncbi:cleavage stimulation factor subunit 3-like [Symsagittifera roscoffensis]|uniref:cleavage stimulation factor subunit 3-like n=1 Tax=Symsagittifera roscoffensis TaxID=84072 RepID=UPI00307C61D8
MGDPITGAPVSYGVPSSHRSNNSVPPQPVTEFSSQSMRLGSKIERAEKGIAEDPYNVECWSVLVKETSNMLEEESRRTYERLVHQFPTCGKYWKIYIDFEVKLQNYELVEKLFQRCLTKVLNLELWKSYLAYVRETKGNLPNFKENMANAYDFALEKVGTDIMAYTIWNDYLVFLKGIEAQGTYAENQKITAVRRIYQRGCATPLINVDTLWKEYNSFENSVNHLLAKKIIEEKTRDYIAARKVAKEYEAVTRHLIRNVPAVPPGHRSGLAAAGIAEERSQLEHWRKYFKWEKDNPLGSEDYLFISKRVTYSYEQCLLVFGHHPDVWCEVCAWLQQVSQILNQKGDSANSKAFLDSVANMHERAISHLMKLNHLMYFAYADYEESRMKMAKVHQIYERALAVEDLDPTLVYIQFMKFARRSEGIKTARAIFKRAREDKRSGAFIYVAAALIEFYCSKDQNIAYKIFELGLRKHQNETAYITAYLDFLSHLNDVNNTRVLFEKALASKTPDHCLEVWENYISFESLCGDLASIQKVEKKRMTAFPEVFEGREAKMLIDRYKFLDLVPVSEAQLKAMQYQTALPHLQKKFKNIAPLTSAAAFVTSGGLYGDEISSRSQLYPLPDTTQMIPFKPNRSSAAESLIVPGGDFPIPPAAASILRKLPPPNCFQGPFVILDEFMKQMLELELPEASGSEVRGQVGLKRALIMEEEDSDDDEGGMRRRSGAFGSRLPSGGATKYPNVAQNPPVNDIYRQRQQMKSSSGFQN